MLVDDDPAILEGTGQYLEEIGHEFKLAKSGDMTTAIEALHLGVDDYLLKPCSPEELELRVARCFERLALNRKIKPYENPDYF